MNRFIEVTQGFALLCAALLLGSTSIYASQNLRGYVEKISDGDTIWFQPARSQLSWMTEALFEADLGWSKAATRHKVRMMGMDTPESHLPTKKFGVVGQGEWGDRATHYLERIISVNDSVILQTWGKDKYKRTLGYVFKTAQQDVNLTMVLGGYAIPYIICAGPTCNRDYFRLHRVRDYLMNCDVARKARRGIFNPRNPLREMPFEFRLRMMERSPEKYVADYDTHELYEPEDYKEVDVCRRIFFMSSAEALRLGFKWSDIYQNR